jgi:hypothetical protein
MHIHTVVQMGNGVRNLPVKVIPARTAPPDGIARSGHFVPPSLAFDSPLNVGKCSTLHREERNCQSDHTHPIFL